MKVIFQLLCCLLIFSQVAAQDTILLKNTTALIAYVDEVGEDTLQIHYPAMAGNPKTDKIPLSAIRKINYKSGYTENMKASLPDNHKTDEIQLVSAATIHGYILEVADTAVIIDLQAKDSTAVIPLSQVVQIRYASGYLETYHQLQTKITEPVLIVKNNKQEKGSPPQMSVNNKAGETTKGYPPAVSSNSNASKNLGEQKNISLGIGMMIDSLSVLNRSFAFYQLFRDNPVILNGAVLNPRLIDYPFSYETDYAVTGMFYSRYALIKLYKKGKKIKEIRTQNDWNDIYIKIAGEISGGNAVIAKKKITVDEGSHYHFPDSHIDEYFPGGEEIKLTSPLIHEKLKDHMKVAYTVSKDIHKDIRDIYLKYSRYNENSLFFFRNDNVPTALKNAVRPILFPLYKRIYSSVAYLDYGTLLLQHKEYGESANCLMSALYASHNLLSSPYDKSLIRNMVFSELSDLHAASANRTYTVGLFKLAAGLNQEFLNSEEARNQRSEYYNGINAIQQTSIKAEDAARKIRGQKRLGGFMAIVSIASAAATTNAYDNTVSNAFLDQANATFSQTFTQASEASNALNEQYKNIEETIDAKSFLTADGESVEIGKSFLAEEVFHFLNKSPGLYQKLLLGFCADKPVLKKLVTDFYTASDNLQQAKLLKEIAVKMAELEVKVLNYELRNIPLPLNIKNSF